MTTSEVIISLLKRLSSETAGTPLSTRTSYICLPSCRTILHDPGVYPNPEKFDPDRFLSNDPAVVEPVYVAFGYGRRMCPGRFMAEGQLWISIACILSVFEIASGKDDSGRVLTTEAKFASGMIWYVIYFPIFNEL